MIRAALLGLVLSLGLAAGASGADANVWKEATERPAEASADERHELALQTGDELVLRANARGQSRGAVATLVDRAISAYRQAAAARPNSAEPYFRIATVIESFYLDCMPMLSGWRPPTCPIRVRHTDAVRAKQAVDAWDAFEARAPLDPRLAQVLFSRAILRTKLVQSAKGAKPLLEGALRDYLALLDRADGLTMIRLEQVWGNLAETYMMLGMLEEAIDAYQVAIDKGGDGSTYYGKAVALDRDERGAEALEMIRRQGPREFQDFVQSYQADFVFYVPEGEVHYYFGLIYEAFGQLDQAIAHWKAFLKSGAHPQYHARAKAHLDALVAKQKTTPRPPPPPDVFDGYPYP